MRKIIWVIATLVFMTGFLASNSWAGYYRVTRTYCARPAVVVAPRPYRGYYYRPAPVVVRPAPVVYAPAPVVVPAPAPVVYAPAPWVPGVSVFLPGVSIHIP